ncbi:hypothetical protein H9Y13_04545 [Aeromonas veronii]|uniref:hypothetical protein n=1 Tax=Aeromonas TaxID=642 RepID=UPI0022EA4073|nr:MULTISPECIES: hypothetical protein [Aeromonas]KAJ8742075.1 hypothetical protein H9Y13_04545 [Aeromonas veronii]MDA3315359.1 hypothetical protein [Aeromonas sp. PI_26]
MEQFILFVKSDVGVVISWICTVGSTVFAIMKSKQNKQLKAEIQNLTVSTVTDHSQDIVNQSGQTNIYTQNNSGGMNIKM